MMARRISGSDGCGGGPLGATFFPPPRCLQAPVLQISKGDANHQRVPMQASPGPAFEVAEPEFLLELLVHLLARPARLDAGDQPPQRGPLRQVAEVVLLLAAVAPFADQPELLARQADALDVERPIRHAHPHGGEAGIERALGAVAPGDATPTPRLQHLSGRARRPVGQRMFGWPSGRRVCRTQFDGGRIDKLGAGDASRPGQPARVEPVAEDGAAAEPGIGQHTGKRRPASRTRSISASAIAGLLCAGRAAAGTPAASQRSGSSVQAGGRNSRIPTGSGTSPRASVSVTSTCAFATLPSSPQYCRATPTESSPFLGRPESSTTSTAPAPPICRSTCSASTRHSGASSQARLLMKWCNWSCPDKPSRSAIGWTLLRPPEPSSPRTYSGAIFRRVLRPVASRKGSSQWSRSASMSRGRVTAGPDCLLERWERALKS